MKQLRRSFTKVIWSGDPTAIIAPIGRILPWLVVPPTCPIVNLSRPQALQLIFHSPSYHLILCNLCKL